MPWLRQLLCCGAICSLASLGALSAQVRVAAQEEAQTAAANRTEERIHARVRAMAETQASVPVFLVLANQPHRTILERVRVLSTLKNQAAEAQYRRVLQASADEAQMRGARAGLDAITLEMRQEAFRAIEAEIGPQQAAVESRLRGLGATRIGRYKGINMLTAEIPNGVLPQLEADPLIARIWPVERLQSQIVNSVPAIGAPTFWTSGYTGQGESVAVLDSGVRTNHPAFAGKNIVSQIFLTYGSTDSCFADNASSPQDQVGHGTHVAGIVASQGSMEGTHDWTHYQGVAKGINTLYNVKIGYLLLPTQNCADTTQVKVAVADLRDITQALDWIVSNTSASVINLSYGTPATQYDDPEAQMFDHYADTYDLSVAIAAGNSGTDFPNVSTPSIAFNVLSVGNWDTGGLANNSHEVMNPTSSIGPAPQGQFKPDLAAPGTNIYSAAYEWDGNGGANPDYVQHTGTSMAAPHVAGALALLRSTLPSNGQSGPLARAILVNTADMPATSAFWQKDSGWGYLNLTTAWSQRSLYDIVTLGGSSGAPAYKLYKVPLTGQRLKITAAWNRHLSGYSVDPTGVPTFTGSGLNALVLTPYDPAANTVLGSGTPNWMGGINHMSLDLTAPHPSNAIVTAVWNKGTSGTQDQFAIAFSSGFTPVAGPLLQLSCDLPPVLYVGMQFTLTCTPSNTGDLTAFHVEESCGGQSGMGGGNIVYGDLQPGQTGTPGVIDYLLVPTVAGDYPLEVNLSSQSYGLNFGPDIQLTVHAAPNPDWGPWLGCAGPGSVPAGSSGLHVVMTGENFFPNATAYWNGTALATTFVNTLELGATVPASLLGTATTASLTVTNPTGPRSVVRNIEVRPVLPQPAGTIDTFAGGANMCYSGQNIDGNPATAAQFGGLSGLAADNVGNVYIADGNMIRRVTSNGIISTFAGSSTAGYSGDGGPATSALLKNPFALAVDQRGNVYIADDGNYVIRKVDSSGIITTYAGNNVNGYSGDGGLATSASLSGVAGMAVDGAGNLYFSDPSNIRVRMVSPQGTISTVAGNGTIGYTGDGGRATSATLSWPNGVAVDATGNLYFVDGGNGVIRKVNATGTITTIAGGGVSGIPGDGGPAKNAYLGQPTSLAIDGLGNMFVLDSGHVRKVGSNGIINAFAGYGNGNVSGDGGPALDAGFWSPWALAADSVGNVYIAESGSNGVVRKVAASGASTTAPFLSSLSPPVGVAGGQDFTLTVTGRNFVFGSSVLWDGGTLITQYVSPTVLAAGVPAALIATVGNHTIAVRTPAPASAQTSPILYAVQAIPPGTPTLVATPNPVPVPPGFYSYGRTTLNWYAPGHKNVYVSQTVFGAGGSILATGGSTGSTIVSTYPDGTRFFLIDADTNHTLASLTLTTFTDTRNIGAPKPPAHKKSDQ